MDELLATGDPDPLRLFSFGRKARRGERQHKDTQGGTGPPKARQNPCKVGGWGFQSLLYSGIPESSYLVKTAAKTMRVRGMLSSATRSAQLPVISELSHALPLLFAFMAIRTHSSNMCQIPLFIAVIFRISPLPGIHYGSVAAAVQTTTQRLKQARFRPTIGFGIRVRSRTTAQHVNIFAFLFKLTPSSSRSRLPEFKGLRTTRWQWIGYTE
ncbi:hypothetical protein C8R44DRAFT_751625 [Mycena epipterygia]|nr:hypothetical protein C8R44DRAFT_751625 [Mycena epipterygia]